FAFSQSQPQQHPQLLFRTRRSLLDGAGPSTMLKALIEPRASMVAGTTRTPTDNLIISLFFLAYAVLVLATCSIAKRKARSQIRWLFCALFLPGLSLVLVLLASDLSSTT